MSKLLIVENSIINQAVFKELLDEVESFEYDIVETYAQAKKLLTLRRYEYAVVERVVEDAPNGEIIALFNKYYVAPIVFTKEIDEDFFDDFEGAQIVDYVQKIEHKSALAVVKKLQQLRRNKEKTVLIVSDSSIYSRYLKQNLNLHSFKVFHANNNSDFEEKLNLHPETDLLIVDSSGPYLDNLKAVEYAKRYAQGSDMKILVLAEESNSYETSQLLNYGADDYLIKDFSRAEFYVRVYQNINNFS